MANPNCADCERLMADSASPSEEVWCPACQPVEPVYSEEAALLDRLEALDRDTAQGPWRWHNVLGSGDIRLMQDRNRWPAEARALGFGGLAEVLSVEKPRKGPPEVVLWNPDDFDKNLCGGLSVPVSAVACGSAPLTPHPIARWFEEGRQAFADAVKLALGLADRLDQAQKVIKALGDRLSEACKAADALKAEVVEMKWARDFPEKQATTCADCGVYKHTPWRGAQGYICAGCLAKERDQAREMAVWAYCQGEKWVALAPHGQVLGNGRWCPAEGDEADEFNTEDEALSAGRGAEVGWWEGIAQ